MGLALEEPKVNDDRNVEVVMMIDSIESFREFVQSTSEQYHTLTRQAPDLKWAKSIKRLSEQTSEVLVTASPLLQNTQLFHELRILHNKILNHMKHHAGIVDSENRSGSRF